MSWVGAAIGGSALLGAGASLFASNKQSEAAANALAQQNAMYKQTQANLSPYMKVGGGALISLGQLYGIGADGKPTGQPYNPQALEAFRNSPDYKFAFDQGNQALTFSNAAKGLLQSGSNLKDIVGFGQGLASQQFGNYVNRLSGLANMGQNSAAGAASNALGFAGQMGNTTLAGGQAGASGAVGAANALTGGIGSYLNYNQQQQNNQMLQQALSNRNVGGSNAVGSIAPTDYAGGGPLGYAEGGRPPVGWPVSAALIQAGAERLDGPAAGRRVKDEPGYRTSTCSARRAAGLGSKGRPVCKILERLVTRFLGRGCQITGSPTCSAVGPI